MMKYINLIFFTICILISACSPKRAKNIPSAAFVPRLSSVNFINPDFKLPNIPPTPPRLVLSMERKPCYIGKSPAFTIEFFEDGTVFYNGRQAVDLYGKHTTMISKEALGTLLNMAKNIDYLSFQNVYPTSGKIIMDVPLTITYVKLGIDENYIEDHHHAPIALVRFEEHIETLIENLDWKKADAI